jgi:hypothetical protein
MEFTEAQAKAKVGRWVRVHDDALWQVRIPRGTWGIVVSAQPQQREEGSREEEGWVVSLEFALAPDNAVRVCLRDVDQAQYTRTFAELPAELSLENTEAPEDAHSLKRHADLARRKTLAVVRRSPT